MKNNNIIKRGQVWYCDLSGIKGSEQGGVRPCLIIQNDKGNLGFLKEKEFLKTGKQDRSLRFF